MAADAYVKPTHPDITDQFGWAVSIDGDYVAVGAPNESSATSDPSNNSAGNAGAAYVFARAGTVWAQDGYLKAAQPRMNDGMGTTVAVDQNHVVVGNLGEDSISTGIDSTPSFRGSDVGAVNVFRRTTTWGERHYIKAGNAQTTDYFGASVAVDSDTLVVGAFGEDSSTTGVATTPATDDGATRAGAVYVYR